MLNIINWFWGSILLTFSYIYFYFMLAEPKINLNLKTLSSFLGISTIFSLVEYFEPFWINSFGYLLLFPLIGYPFLIYHLNPHNIKNAIYYSITLWFYEVLIIVFIMLGTFLLQNLNLVSIMEDMYVFSSQYVIFVLFIIGAHLKPLKNFLNRILDHLKSLTLFDLYIFYFTGITLLLSIVLILNLTTYKEEILISCIILLLLFTFNMILKEKSIFLENKRLNRTIISNNIKYESINEEFSLLKHNITSKLDSIKSISNGPSKELINDLIYEVNNKQELKRPIEINYSGLKGIILEKITPYANILNQKLEYNISNNIYDFLDSKRYKAFISSVMLALDNAIESTIKSLSKLLVISAFEEENNFNVEIRNSYNSTLDLEVLGTKHYSTKGHKRGLGLYSILNETEITSNIRIVNDIFIIQITVFKNKNI